MSDIILEKIVKSFDGKNVLSGISAEFADGSITCIGGPSGCGKTTLLNIIAGLAQADDGRIAGVPGKISYVFQENRLCDDFTALRNLRIAAPKDADKETITAHLRELGLENDLKKPVREYSGGMKRRVAIARAMICESDLILMDEPFKGLDEKLRQSVMDYVLRNRRGRTLICVTHDRTEADYLGARYLEMPLHQQ